MANTREYKVDGVTMEVSFKVTNVDRDVVIEKLEEQEIPATDENVDAVVNFIKNIEDADLETSSLDEFVNGEDGGFAGSYTVFDFAFEELGLEPEDEDEDED